MTGSRSIAVKTNYRLGESELKTSFVKGISDGIPIALGYLAVSFSLGITAQSAGIGSGAGFMASLFTCASAGEYAVFTMIAHGTTCLAVILATIVINLRYMLMSCAISQKLPDNISFVHRLLMGLTVTDEIFGITIRREGDIVPWYSYGALAVAAPSWALGTMLGITAGNVLPAKVVCALGVMLYGMFLAVVVPAAKTDKSVMITVLAAALLSFIFSELPVISALSDGSRTIILTVLISAVAAYLFPVKHTEEDQQ